MILINAPLKRDFIISLLDGQTIDNITFNLDHQDGMKLFFIHNGEGESASKIAKKVIQSSEFGKALFFNVTEV